MARDFNHATGDRIDWASVANLTGHALTISLWVYWDEETISGFQYLFAIHNSDDTGRTVYLYSWQNTAVSRALGFARIGATVLTRLTNGDAFPGGQWVHLLATHDGTFTSYAGMHYYINGVEATYANSTNGATETAATGSWSVAGRKYSDNVNLNGKLAFVGVWDAVVNAATIAGLAAKNSPDFYPTNLLFYAINGADYTNHVTGANGTLDGTIVYADPPQNWPWNKKTTRVGNESINRSTIW